MAWSPVRPAAVLDRGRALGVAGHHPHYVGSLADGPVFWLNVPGGVFFYGLDLWCRDLVFWHRVKGRYLTIALVAREREGIMTFLRKVEDKRDARAGGTSVDPEAMSRWPCIWEHLTAPTYGPDGPPRALSTVTLFLGHSGLTGTLNDKDNAQACFASADTVLGVLDALEACASNPGYAWRQDRNLTGSSARKKR